MRTTGQYVMDLVQCYLRAAELEMRAAEEPLSSDLDVAGLKAQVLGRIEELETREREREELLAELLPALGARGYGTEAVKAMMRGKVSMQHPASLCGGTKYAGVRLGIRRRAENLLRKGDIAGC